MCEHHVQQQKGDAGNLRLINILLDLKKRHPERVELIIGACPTRIQHCHSLCATRNASPTRVNRATSVANKCASLEMAVGLVLRACNVAGCNLAVFDMDETTRA